jgi:hypothetical protein
LWVLKIKALKHVLLRSRRGCSTCHQTSGYAGDDKEACLDDKKRARASLLDEKGVLAPAEQDIILAKYLLPGIEVVFVDLPLLLYVYTEFCS